LKEEGGRGGDRRIRGGEKEEEKEKERMGGEGEGRKKNGGKDDWPLVSKFLKMPLCRPVTRLRFPIKCYDLRQPAAIRA
jgi:hypothetical protein